MEIALNETKQRIEAVPRTEAICPGCFGPVISKCGEIKIWHWAHVTGQDCDRWSEPESLWHKQWKDKYPIEEREVVMGCHRADIKTKRLVVELQSDTLSTQEIQEREIFYGKMIWLLRGDNFQKNLDFREKDGYVSFRWKHPRQSWFKAKCPIFIDMAPMYDYLYRDDGSCCDMVDVPNREVFWVKKLYPNIPCGGYGVFITRKEFIRRTC